MCPQPSAVPWPCAASDLDTRSEVQSLAVEHGLARRSVENIERVGLDEKSFGHSHYYGTVLSDLDHNRVLEVVEHREQASAQQVPATCRRSPTWRWCSKST